MNKIRAYFNYAGLGLISNANWKGLSNFIDDYCYIRPPKVILKYRNYIPMLYLEVSKLLNCKPSEIVYIKNTTEGIIIASESIPLVKGDEVIIMNNEYSANYIPWLKKQKDGIIIHFIDGVDNNDRFNNLLKAINNKTKIISVSWIHYYDGYRINLEKLSEICKKHSIFLVVDGIQGIGTRMLDLKKISVDFLVCGGHKHLGAIVGSGFMYINSKTINKLNDFKVGTRSVEHFQQGSYKLKQGAERFEDGTPNLAGIVSLYHAIKEINTIGIDKIETKNLSILLTIKQKLQKNKIKFFDYRNQGNIISLKTSDSVKLRNNLIKDGVYVKTIKDIVRISFSFKTTNKEIQILINSISKIGNYK